LADLAFLAGQELMCASIYATLVAEQYGVQDRVVDLLTCDVTTFSRSRIGNMFDSIVTDPPYGVSSSPFLAVLSSYESIILTGQGLLSR
jgi:tRNA G10  N-methylase Trm11